MPQYVIIGSGAAGVSAIEAIRTQDEHGEILLIGDEREGFYSRPGLAYFLTNEIPEKQLFPFKRDDFDRLKVKLLFARVMQIHTADQLVELHDGSKISYDRLLIATGASAAQPALSGAELEGVVKLDNLNDVRKIIKLARRGSTAVVIGGGITALELVEGLLSRSVKTHYFLRKDRYWNNVLDETESRIIEHRLKEEGVRIHYNTEAAEIIGKKGKVVGIRTTDGKEIKCNIVAIAIGIRPRMQLAANAGIATDRGILVNEYLQTEAPNVYAAGDVAQVFDPLSGKSVLDSLWTPARLQGYAAGLNMAGKPTMYLKEVPFNVTRLAGLTTTIIGTVGRGVDEDLIGIARGDSETWRELPDVIACQNNFDVNRVRLLVGEKTLVGAVIMGDQTLSHPLQELIVQHADITPVRSQLLKPQVAISNIIADFWISWRQQNAAQQP
ncbi:MAG: FAD-dependent oxidoreductase [Anaerolineae bacterium]|nr:FAD-dependent oxidoreductase [Anaerolineae bacterium]